MGCETNGRCVLDFNKGSASTTETVRVGTTPLSADATQRRTMVNNCRNP